MDLDCPRSIQPTRRQVLGSVLFPGIAAAAHQVREAKPQEHREAAKAAIAITLDLEMSRNYPTWDQTHWDYQKGNLDGPTKAYAVEAARRVHGRGGVIHFFALGQTMEQEDVGWLGQIVAQGHPVGNHTYDHVNVKATKPEDIQFRFRRAPWLIQGKTPREVIAENIRLGDEALRQRLGIIPAGFRTPGGFSDGLSDRPDLQAMLLKMGYRWVSSKYPAHPLGQPGHPPDPATIAAIARAQEQAQPFTYASGLVEVPMSPVSDVTAFRVGKWRLESFLEAVQAAVTRAIDQAAVFCFLAHPSCLLVTDPEFRSLDLICDLVERSGGRADLVDLETVARRASPVSE